MTNWNTLGQILAHNSHNKYGFQAIDQVRNVLLTLLTNEVNLYRQMASNFFEMTSNYINKWLDAVGQVAQESGHTFGQGQRWSDRQNKCQRNCNRIAPQRTICPSVHFAARRFISRMLHWVGCENILFLLLQHKYTSHQNFNQFHSSIRTNHHFS